MKGTDLFDAPPLMLKIIALAVLFGIGGTGSAMALRAGRPDLVPLMIGAGLGSIPLVLLILFIRRAFLWLQLALYWYAYAALAVVGLLCALPFLFLYSDRVDYAPALAGLQLRGDSIGAIVFAALAGVVALVWMFSRVRREKPPSEPPGANPPDPVADARDLSDLAAYVDKVTRK